LIHVDVPLLVSFGAMFADAAQKQIRTGDPAHAHRAQLQANLFHALFFLWAPLYFMVAYFGWETSHLWWHGDSVADYPLLLPGLLVVFTLAVNVGFMAGKWLVIRRRQGTLYALYGATAVFGIGWLIVMNDRVSRLGTYREFAAGQAPRLTDDSTFLTMLALNLVVTAGALTFFVARLIREGQHLERAPAHTRGGGVPVRSANSRRSG